MMQGNNRVIGAYLNGKICSYAVISISDKIDLLKIYTEKIYRQLGIGGELINHIKDSYSLPVILEVNENNSNAINFYKSLGFKQISTREKYYGSDNAIIMEK
jgi:ribosomal-protein-alanine N-acetyltransferase